MIRATELTRTYQLAGAEVRALRGVTFAIRPGEYVALVGPSGSGKSTLMNILGLLDTPSSGEYLLDGRTIADRDEDELALARNRFIGFVFQSHNLLPRNTILENVCLPLYYRGEANPQSRAAAALERVGLADRMSHFPGQISGGESQRAAIARAIVTEPKVILADEPTGNLDTVNSRKIEKILHTLNDDGVTIVMVTHDREVAASAGRMLYMRDGELI